MTASTTSPLHVFRGLLRKIKHSQNHFVRPTSGGDASKSLKDHIIEQYRTAKSSSPEKIQVLRKVAYDYYTLQKDLAERARLYELDSGAEKILTPKELSKRAATRSGLQLPKLYSEEKNIT